MTASGGDGNWLTEDTATSDYSNIGNPYMFTGRRWDSDTKLYYYRFRDYSPQLGRFLQCDPAGYIDTMNLYAYCANNPVNWIDPFGLCKEEGSTVTMPDGTEIPCPNGYDPLKQAEASRNIDPLTWYNKVNHGGSWDWKREGHKDMEITHPEYEALGNFDYGVTGSAQGIPASVLHWGARRAGGGEESAQDTYNINQGIQWYKENKHNLPRNYPADTYWSPTANMPLNRP